MALDKQINLFKLNTTAFMWGDELKKYTELCDLRKEKNKLNSITAKEERTELTTWINEAKSELLDLMKENIGKQTRVLNDRNLFYTDKYDGTEKIKLNNVVAMFESTLSRSFEIQTNELTFDIFIVEIFFYDVAKDMIINGFDYNGKHYVYFSSSAGQIRKKKAVFVEEKKYNKCKMKLMCGLTVDHINECGGMNINKFLAYLALSNSATDLWEDVFDKPFDIDKSIVVDDFETMVDCKVDHINYETYEITPDIIEKIPIPHTDGCGIISSDYCSKNFMVRLPFIKGLLGSFDFKKFIIENNASTKVKDIWGKEYDVFEDDIQVIFTKSQLKMYKYYSSWDEYKSYFKKYNCEACICNMEEDQISNAKINYQMLQTLHDATDDEIAEICKYPNKKIQEVGSSLENVLDFFGVHLDKDEDNKDWFQKSLKIYPELLNDPAHKADVRDLKNSYIRKYRGAHLDVVGKFTFVLPDLYAFCEWLFLGIENPKGLLENNEVYCRLYKNSKELDCLRSPHLYIEHAIRNNVCDKKYRNQYLREWFKTDAIYTSTYDPISRILQFDVDGDRLLVLAQEKILSMAKRCTIGVNPLYYEMHKANAELITNESIYNGLQLAFTGGNIGGISNNITKIWNSGDITEDALKAVRWLCMETNFTIDYAKTLFKPTRPKDVDEIIKQYTKSKTPYFFTYAKGKQKSQVEEINDSTINKIVKEIKDNRNIFSPIKNLGEVDYKLLLRNKEDKYYNEDINKIFDRWNKKYGNNLVIDEDDLDKNNIIALANQVKDDLRKIEKDENNILNSLVVFLYKKPSSRKKKLLWYVFGEELFNNLNNNINKEETVCSKCGKRSDEKLISGKCFNCRQAEIKSTGFKMIKCIDCGKELLIKSRSRAIRCDECAAAERKRINQQYYNDKIKTSSFSDVQSKNGINKP